MDFVSLIFTLVLPHVYLIWTSLHQIKHNKMPWVAQKLVELMPHPIPVVPTSEFAKFWCLDILVLEREAFDFLKSSLLWVYSNLLIDSVSLPFLSGLVFTHLNESESSTASPATPCGKSWYNCLVNQCCWVGRVPYIYILLPHKWYTSGLHDWDQWLVTCAPIGGTLICEFADFGAKRGPTKSIFYIEVFAKKYSLILFY